MVVVTGNQRGESKWEIKERVMRRGLVILYTTKSSGRLLKKCNRCNTGKLLWIQGCW